jgi:cell division septation protein DedD
MLLLATAAWAGFRLTRRPSEGAGEATTGPVVPTPVADPIPVVEIDELPAEPEPLDTLYYSVQVAAFNTLDRALEYATSLEDRRLVAAVTPVRIGAGTWYRVILGAMRTAAEAEAALAALWQDGLVASGEGAILRTPQAFDLGIWESADAAREETRRLRERGIPAYSVGVARGRARILVGAFETPDQSAVAESLLTAAGLTATLMTRTGNAP